MTFYQFFKRPVNVVMFVAGEGLWTCAVIDPLTGSILWNPVSMIGIYRSVVKKAKTWAKQHDCKVWRVERAG